jgi:hypothetical protein
MHHAVTYYLGRTPEGTIEVVSFDSYRRPRVGSIQDQTFLSMKMRRDGSMDFGDTHQTRHLLVYRLKSKEQEIADLWEGAETISDRFKKILVDLMTRLVDGKPQIPHIFDGLKHFAKMFEFTEKLDRLTACCLKVRIKKIPPPRPKEK